ncbi:zinc ribbon domain-containing protein [Grylomicrobium aquisgranensis]
MLLQEEKCLSCLLQVEALRPALIACSFAQSKVGKFFPSSQMCHECGALHKLTKDLSVREWTCPDCRHQHDRDENAALNIRDEAVRIYCTC